MSARRLPSDPDVLVCTLAETAGITIFCASEGIVLADLDGHNGAASPRLLYINDLGSLVSGGGGQGERGLPKMFSGAVWAAGSVQETMWTVRSNHGGGYQYRLCPSGSELTEDCFQQTPLPFAIVLPWSETNKPLDRFEPFLARPLDSSMQPSTHDRSLLLGRWRAQVHRLST